MAKDTGKFPERAPAKKTGAKIESFTQKPDKPAKKFPEKKSSKKSGVSKK